MWTTAIALLAKAGSLWRIGVGAAGIIGLLLSYAKGRGDAWTQAEALAHKQWQQRVEAVQKLNEEYRSEIVAMLEQNTKLEEEVEKLREEADNDDNAKRPALGANSVRRLNKIK